MADEPARKPKESAAEGKTGILWEWLGKVSALVAVLGGLFAIYNFLYPRGPSLTAYCTSVSIGGYLKHGYDKGVKDAAEMEKAKRDLEKMSEEKKGHATRDKDGRYPSQIGAPIFKFDVQWLTAPYSESIHAASCRIVNDGTEPANDVTLYLPSRPVRFLVHDKEEKLSESTSVNLKSVPAGPPTNVEVWFKGSPDLREERLFINYQGGKGKVVFGKTYFGLWHTIKENWVWYGMYLLLALAIVMQTFIWVKGDR